MRMRPWAFAATFMVAACTLVWLAVRWLDALFGRHTGWVLPLGTAPWLLIVGRMVAQQLFMKRTTKAPAAGTSREAPESSAVHSPRGGSLL